MRKGLNSTELNSQTNFGAKKNSLSIWIGFALMWSILRCGGLYIYDIALRLCKYKGDIVIPEDTGRRITRIYRADYRTEKKKQLWGMSQNSEGIETIDMSC